VNKEEDIYVYVHFLDIGNASSPRANMLMIEKQDIIEMFQESTKSEITAYELSGMKPDEFFPMDGASDEQESTYILFKV
tara:strand:- start:1386 stop:1622 length:237 start_codon:yes stop_codon:yes gene_type:complete